MRFGRLPHDQQRIGAAPQLHRYAIAAPSPIVDRRNIGFTPLLGGNDSLPDCTAVAYFNCALAASWAITGVPTATLEANAPRFYAECIGNPNATMDELAATDGAMILDVLAYQAQHGCDVGQQSRLVAHYGVIAPTDRMGIAGAIEHLGSADLGIRLYQSDMDMVGTGPWDDDGTADPGALVGLHSLMAWDYAGLADDALVRLGTWGNWQPATWRWLAKRLDEAHGLLWRQFAAPGVDYAALDADVSGRVA